jgi:D-alanyl-D-alanine carboxypeptidase
MAGKINEAFLSSITDKIVDNKRVFSAVLRVENEDGSLSYSGAAGRMEPESRYFIASVTKMYITAVVMQLVEEGRIQLDDRICKYLPEDYCQGLHVLKGADHSGTLTVRHLISNTSGLPDYFFHKQANGNTVASELMEGKDEPWPLERTIGLVKALKPKFRPGAKGKAAYSDTNYQLLGRIIETVAGKPIGQVFHDMIFSPLGFKDTYAYHDPEDNSPAPFYYQSRQLWLPRYMTSIAPEGGIVSTPMEVMAFMKAFFNGRFFPKEKIQEMKQWNLILPPPGLFFYGIGLEKLWTPRIISPLKPIGEILGFWGQTGSFAFHNPTTDLYFCGTTNQINGAGHRKATSAMLKIIKAAL